MAFTSGEAEFPETGFDVLSIRTLRPQILGGRPGFLSFEKHWKPEASARERRVLRGCVGTFIT